MRNHLLPLLLLMFAVGRAGAEVKQQELTQEFRDRLVEAIAAFQEKDFELSLAKVSAAEQVQAGTSAAANIRGAIALETGDYAEAEKMFRRALEVDPTFYPAKFNLGEIPFKKKQYAESRAHYEKLLAENPKDELVQYKIFLTYLLEQRKEEAGKILENMKFPSDTPAYYFAHAAWEYSRKNVEEAEGWVMESARIFPPHINLLYAQTLEELGWLKRKKPGDPVE